MAATATAANKYYFMQIPLLADFATPQPMRIAKVSAISRAAIFDTDMLRIGNRDEGEVREPPIIDRRRLN
jgi:hypothetical protein